MASNFQQDSDDKRALSFCAAGFGSCAAAWHFLSPMLLTCVSDSPVPVDEPIKFDSFFVENAVSIVEGTHFL